MMVCMTRTSGFDYGTDGVGGFGIAAFRWYGILFARFLKDLLGGFHHILKFMISNHFPTI